MNGKFLGLFAALALILAACGGGDDAASALPLNDATSGGGTVTAGACVEGEPDCEDTFVGTGEPTDIPRPGVSIATAIEIDGGFVIEGFYFADDRGIRLCELLAESLPPLCGGAVIPFDNSAGVDLGILSVAQGVTWSDQPVLVVGNVVDGVFVAQ